MFIVITSLEVLFLILQENGSVHGTVAMSVTSVLLEDAGFARIHFVLGMLTETSSYIRQLALSARSMIK